QVIEREPEQPSKIEPTAPRDLEVIALKCLRKDPRRRYASAAQLADDLTRWLRREPIRARPAGAVERAFEWARRRPTGAAFLATGLLALVLVSSLAGVASYQWQAAAAALKKADQEQKARTLAQVEALRDADPGAVRQILSALEGRAEVVPRLRELHEQEK